MATASKGMENASSSTWMGLYHPPRYQILFKTVEPGEDELDTARTETSNATRERNTTARNVVSSQACRHRARSAKQMHARKQGFPSGKARPEPDEQRLRSAELQVEQRIQLRAQLTESPSRPSTLSIPEVGACMAYWKIVFAPPPCCFGMHFRFLPPRRQLRTDTVERNTADEELSDAPESDADHHSRKTLTLMEDCLHAAPWHYVSRTFVSCTRNRSICV